MRNIPRLAATLGLSLILVAAGWAQLREAPASQPAASPEERMAQWQRMRAEGRRAFELGQFAAAAPLLEGALRLAQSLPPASNAGVDSLRDLAALDRATGKLAEAEGLLRAVLVTRESQVGANSAELGPDIDALGWVVFGMMRYPESLTYFARSLAILEAAHGNRHLAIIPALLNKARITALLKQDTDTVVLLSRTIDIRETARGKEHPEVAGDLMRLGRYHHTRQREVEAESAYVRSISILEKANGALSFSLTTPLEELAAVYVAGKRFPDAEALLRRTLAIRELNGGPLNPENAGVWEKLGDVLDQLKRPAESELAFRRALQLWVIGFGDDHPLIASALDRVAMACAAQQKLGEAEEAFRRALRIRDKAEVTNLNNLGLMVGAQQREAEAEPFYVLALSVIERPKRAPLDTDFKALLKATLENYADVLEHRKQLAAANRLRARAKALAAEIVAAARQAQAGADGGDTAPKR
jgi:tetratricopeptide (TPR) repeat protein